MGRFTFKKKVQPSSAASKPEEAPKKRTRKPKTSMLDNPAVVARLKEIPTSFRKVYRMAVSGRSRTAAQKAFCGECCGWVRKEVRCCSSPACPLFPYRPFQTEAEEAQEEVTVDENEE